MVEVSNSTDSGGSVRRASVPTAPKRPAPKVEREEATARDADENSKISEQKRTEKSERTARQLRSPAPELALNVANTLALRATNARIRTLTVDVTA